MVPNHLNEAQKAAVESQLDEIDQGVLELHLLMQSLEVGSGDGNFLTSVTDIRGLTQNIDRYLFSLMQTIERYWDHNRGPYTVTPTPPRTPTLEDLSL